MLQQDTLLLVAGRSCSKLEEYQCQCCFLNGRLQLTAAMLLLAEVLK